VPAAPAERVPASHANVKPWDARSLHRRPHDLHATLATITTTSTSTDNTTAAAASASAASASASAAASAEELLESQVTARVVVVMVRVEHVR